MCSIFNLTKIITVSWAENNISPLTDVQSQNNKTSFFKLWATQHQSAKADGTLLFVRCRIAEVDSHLMVKWQIGQRNGKAALMTTTRREHAVKNSTSIEIIQAAPVFENVILQGQSGQQYLKCCYAMISLHSRPEKKKTVDIMPRTTRPK